jgi:hypothetical protein
VRTVIAEICGEINADLSIDSTPHSTEIFPADDIFQIYLIVLGRWIVEGLRPEVQRVVYMAPWE